MTFEDGKLGGGEDGKEEMLFGPEDFPKIKEMFDEQMKILREVVTRLLLMTHSEISEDELQRYFNIPLTSSGKLFEEIASHDLSARLLPVCDELLFETGKKKERNSVIHAVVREGFDAVGCLNELFEAQFPGREALRLQYDLLMARSGCIDSYSGEEPKFVRTDVEKVLVLNVADILEEIGYTHGQMSALFVGAGFTAEERAMVFRDEHTITIPESGLVSLDTKGTSGDEMTDALVEKERRDARFVVEQIATRITSGRMNEIREMLDDIFHFDTMPLGREIPFRGHRRTSISPRFASSPDEGPRKRR